MTYELPMNDGEVDFEEILEEIQLETDDSVSIEILQALATHHEALGAEKERQASVSNKTENQCIVPSGVHVYSRSMDQKYPRKCIFCGANEVKP